MKKSTLAASLLLLSGSIFLTSAMASDKKVFRKISSFENQPRVSENCEAFLYAKIDKALPKNQFVVRMRMHSKTDESLVDLTITKDMGNDNFCEKLGTAKIEDEQNGVCRVLSYKIDPRNFDCG